MKKNPTRESQQQPSEQLQPRRRSVYDYNGEYEFLNAKHWTARVTSKFERLLEAGSTELPDCRCAAEMNLMAIVPGPGGDTEIRIFRCPDCSHELTAWRNEAA